MADAKLKLAIPLLEYLGFAKLEAEVNIDAQKISQEAWQKFKQLFQ